MIYKTRHNKTFKIDRAVSVLWLFLITIPFQGHAQSKENYALLWEFQHPDSSKKGYLFGTMHLEDSSVFDFSDQLIPAMEESEVFAMEVHPDSIFNNLRVLLNDIDYKERYKKILGAQDYQALNDQLIEIIGVPLDSLKDNSVDAIDSRIRTEILKDRRNDVETFLDAYLYGVARSIKKSISGLEKVENQIRDQTSITDEELSQSLYWIINAKREDYTSSLDELMGIYVSGDIALIEERMINDSDQSKATMLSRNTIMTHSIDVILKNKSVFAAVGAAHLPGKNGILQLLRDKGYEVSKVDATFNGDVKELIATKSLEFWDTYENKEIGVRLKVPSQNVEGKDKDGAAGMQAFVDLVSGVSVFLIDVPILEGKREKTGEMLHLMLNKFASRMDTVYERTDLLVRKNMKYTSINGSSNGRNMRFDMYASDDNCYVLGADYKEVKNSIAAANYFFESAAFFKPEIPETVMVKVSDSIGGFSVDLPESYVFKKNIVPNPVDPENSNYEMFMYTGQSSKDSLMYLFRYNDFPVAYYLSDMEEHIEAYKQDLIDKGLLINEAERGVVDGLVTVDLQVTMAAGLPARMRLMYRGNRIYLFIVQGGNEDMVVSKDNALFNSFELKEFQLPEFVELIVDESFSFKFPENYISTSETTSDNEVEFKEVTDYMGRSNETGALYTAAVTSLGDYFDLKTSQSKYLDDYMDLLIGENDSIYLKQSFTAKETEGREYYISMKNSPIVKRYRVFFSGKNLVFLATYQEESTVASQQNDSFFNGFLQLQPFNFDARDDKSALLFKDLVSKNQDDFEKAHTALDFYEFDTSHLKKLISLSKKNYPNDSLYFGTKSMLMYHIALQQDVESLPYLEGAFRSEETADKTRALILEILPLYESQRANDLLFQLAQADLISPDYEDRFQFLAVQNDSALPISKYGNKILEIQRNQFYRKRTIDFFERKITNDSGNLMFIEQNRGRFISDFIKDALTVLDSSKSSAARFYPYDLNSYFTILDRLNVKNTEVLDLIHNIAFKEEDRSFTTLLAFEYLMKHQEKLNRAKVLKFIEPLFYRFEGMEKLIENNKGELIPSEYFEPQEFALLSVYNSLFDSDVNTTTKYLDIYSNKGKDYYIFQFNYNDEDPDNPENYLAMVQKELINEEVLSMFTVDFAYDSFKGDWRTVLKEYFLDQELQND